jgi:hypothetical protein
MAKARRQSRYILNKLILCIGLIAGQNGKLAINVTTVVTKATLRSAPLLPLGMKSSRSTPTMGRKVITLRMLLIESAPLVQITEG